MLTHLRIDNYKCLVNFELPTLPLNLLMGPNGSAKTTVFEILYILQQFITQGIKVTEAFSPPH